jgi:hypothetical protein
VERKAGWHRQALLVVRPQIPVTEQLVSDLHCCACSPAWLLQTGAEPGGDGGGGWRLSTEERRAQQSREPSAGRGGDGGTG